MLAAGFSCLRKARISPLSIQNGGSPRQIKGSCHCRRPLNFEDRGAASVTRLVPARCAPSAARCGRITLRCIAPDYHIEQKKLRPIDGAPQPIKAPFSGRNCGCGNFVRSRRTGSNRQALFSRIRRVGVIRGCWMISIATRVPVTVSTVKNIM